MENVFIAIDGCTIAINKEDYDLTILRYGLFCSDLVQAPVQAGPPGLHPDLINAASAVMGTMAKSIMEGGVPSLVSSCSPSTLRC